VTTGPVNQIFLFPTADPFVENSIHLILHLTINGHRFGYLRRPLPRRIWLIGFEEGRVEDGMSIRAGGVVLAGRQREIRAW
jgi:hypothetical protein